MTHKLVATFALALAIVGLTATAALAHQNQITGVATCSTETGEYVVTWSNTGDAGNFGDSVIFASSRTAVATGQMIPRGQTVEVGTETVPGTTTFLGLRETWQWGSGFKNTNSGSVAMDGTCEVTIVRNPKATAVVRCRDHKPAAEFNLGNSGSNVDITFDISVNGSVVRSKNVVAGAEAQVVLKVHEGDQIEVSVGNDVLASNVVKGCKDTTPPTTPPPTSPPPTFSPPPRRGTANTGFSAGPAAAVMVGLVLLGAFLFYLRLSRKGQAYMDRAFKSIDKGESR